MQECCVYRCQALKKEVCRETDGEDGCSAPVGFDLGHCIALAGCSFEAYTDPAAISALAERTANGTKALYTDRAFVKESFQALLRVHVQGATKLPSRDLFGKSDPYVKLSVGKSVAASQIVSAELNPTWNETFFIYVRDVSKDVLTVRVFDADAFKADDALGAAFFPLKGMQFDEAVDVDLELHGDGGGGTLYTTMKLLPFDEALLDDYDEEDIDSVVAVESIDDHIRETLDFDAPEEKTGLDLSDCPTAWKALAIVAGKRAEELFDPVCFVENPETDTQVWVYRNVAKKECVIAFRGTEQFKWRDLVTDTDLKPAVFDIERSSLRAGLSLDFGDISSDELLVHRGFLEAYDSVRGCLFDITERITSGSNAWTIYATGHSLGGALATLCAYELACRWVTDPPRIKLYNFGSPRVGNQTFADAFNQAVSESWRIVSCKDLVTTVPRLAGYRHVQRVVTVDRTGALDFDDSQSGKDHLEGIDIKGFLARTSFEDIGKVVLDYEMQLMQRLMDGSGFEEHMEDNYLTCLQCTAHFSHPQK